MRERLHSWVPWLKAALSIAILFGVAWFFVRVLSSPELQETDTSRSPGRILWDEICAARPIDLLAAGALFVAGLAFPASFWLLLLRRVREPLPVLVGLRAYYLSQLGKYAPLGKGWALLLRTLLASQGGVRPGVAALTGAYETLTSMAAGALLAAVLLLVRSGGDPRQMWLALGLLALAGVPILPGIFNRLVGRVVKRFSAKPLTVPGLGSSTLATGFALAACGWVLLGASLLAVLHALRPAATWQASDWLFCISAVAVSWVAGFVASTPGGLGPREFLLQQALTPLYGARTAVVAVILLRVLWTIAELLCASVVYWFPSPTVRSSEFGVRSEDDKRPEADPVLNDLPIRTPNSELRTPN